MFGRVFLFLGILIAIVAIGSAVLYGNQIYDFFTKDRTKPRKHLRAENEDEDEDEDEERN